MLPNHQTRVGALLIAALLLAACAPEGASVPTPANAPTPAAPPDIADIAGIELGKEIIIPECEKEKAYGMVMYATEGASFPCFKEFKGAGNSLKSKPNLPRGPQHDGNHEIELGPQAVLPGVSPTATILLLDGIPEQVSLKTEGTGEQERLYALLVEKYGTATDSNVAQLGNAMGAKYHSIEAFWQLKRVSVQFFGMLDNPREGYIVASTPKGTKWLSDRQPKSSNSF